jgi:hypothetical protein
VVYTGNEYYAVGAGVVVLLALNAVYWRYRGYSLREVYASD